jgi:hypothetical protein
LLLTAAYCVSLLRERRIVRALIFASSTAPALAWYAFVHSQTHVTGLYGWFTPVPLAGVIDRLIHPAKYPFVPAVRWTADVLDECALAGVLLAFVLSFWPSHTRFPVPERLAAILMTLMGLNLGSPDVWSDVFGFGRVFSPLVVLLVMQTFPTRFWVRALPAALIDLRIGIVLGSLILKVAKAVFA